MDMIDRIRKEFSRKGAKDAKLKKEKFTWMDTCFAGSYAGRAGYTR
jgi:hypothetical protein